MLSPNEQKEENHTLKRHVRKGTLMFNYQVMWSPLASDKGRKHHPCG